MSLPMSHATLEPSTPLDPSLKRKWHTGMMKTWFGTDPASAPPAIEHTNAKAAARSERRKKRKLEEKKEQPQHTYRLIRGPIKEEPVPGPSSVLPSLDLDGLVPFDDDTHYTPHPVPNRRNEDDSQNAAHADGGDDEEHVAMACEEATPETSSKLESTSSTSPSDSAMDVDDTIDKSSHGSPASKLASSGSPDALRQASWSGSPASRKESATNEEGTRRPDDLRGATGGVQEQSRRVASPRASCDLATIAKSALSPLQAADFPTTDSPTEKESCPIAADFNTAWRRFGPMGQKVTSYVPQFPDVPTIEWHSKLTTVSPYIPHEGISRKGKRKEKNKVKWDQTYVETVAKTMQDSRSRPDLCMHVKYTTDEQAVTLIRECMAQGVPLVFDEFPSSLRWARTCTTVDDDPMMKPIAWSQHPTLGVVGANLKTPRDFQDAAVREVNNLKPYVTATLLDFKSWIRTPGKIRCILDLGCGFRQADEITDHIADNVIECLTNSFSNKYSGRFTIVSDMMKTQDWFLLHTSGFLSFGHIDASGMATSAQIRGGGIKQWVVFVCKNMPKALPTSGRQDREKMQSELIDKFGDLVSAASTADLKPPNRDASTRRRLSTRRSSAAVNECSGSSGDFDKGDGGDKTVQVDGCVIELRPGMMYYQPSGTVHAAYTPVPTAAAGKHFFTYDDLHRVEICRRVQMAKKSVTNHNHNCGVQLMLILMAAAIPARAAVEFRRKPMIALGLMLTRPQDYIPAEEPLHPLAHVRTDQKAREGETAEQARAHRSDAENKRRENAERVEEYDMTTWLRSPTWADKGTAFDRLAYTVATRILHHCMTAYPGDEGSELPGPEYIMEGDSWEDPGPVFNVEMFTDELLDVHIDDLRTGGMDYDSDLTDLDEL